MPVFISYSHQDKKFVDQLAAQLVRNKVNVWLDRWELKVGDSLISKVQDAIVGASALLVILSKSSVASEWCKKELNGGLMRELTERRVVVLPVVLDDCDIPLFLREKMYADFRTDFDSGLRSVLEAVAAINTEAQGRVDAPEWHTDWSIDWGDLRGELFAMSLTMVEAAQSQPYSVLSLVDFVANEDATERYMHLRKKGKDAEARRNIIKKFINFIDGDSLTFLFKDNFAQRREIIFPGDEADEMYIVKIESRWMGQDTGRDVIYRLGDALRQIFRQMEEVAFRP
ncbi:MAG: toll/interleukin-1 receptor domain-containing protein [Magnetospirillum sp.]|nr:toll/interleukin-1 receptor domain-containing protein [Magnetospirillum sp.]